MSTASQIDVRITGNAAGAVEAAKLSEEAVSNATNTMRERLISLGLASRENFGIMGVAAEKAAITVTEAAAQIKVATEAMHHGFEKLEGMMGKLNAAMIAIGAVLAGGEMFDKGIEKTVELTGENLKLSKTLGITLEAASGLHAAMARLNISTDTVVGAVQKLDRQVRTHEGTLNDLGVKTRDASGAYLNQMDILFNATEALKGYEAGTSRNIAAQQMFGRGASDVTSLLRLNHDAMEEGLETAIRLSLVTGQDNVDAMRAYKASIAETKEIFEGFWVAIGTQLMPVLTHLAEWFEHHGPVVITATKNAIEGLVYAIRFVVAGFATWQLAIDAIGAAIKGFLSILVTTAKITYDAFHLNWAGVVADWKSGLSTLAAIAHNSATSIKADWASMDFWSPIATKAPKADTPGGKKTLDGSAGAKTGAGKAGSADGGSASADPLAQIRTNFANNLLKMDVDSRKFMTKFSADLAKDPIVATGKAVAGVTKSWKDGFLNITSSWGTSLAKMATLQQGFTATIGQLWGSSVNMITQAIGQMLSTYLMSLVTQDAAGKAQHARQTLRDAKGVYSSTVKSVSQTGAPPPIPQIAGAAAFAGVMAFSAEGGYAVPAGVMAGGVDGRGGSVGVVHPGEMILDEPAANQLRKGGKSSGGDTFIINATDAHSVRRLLMDNNSHVADALKAALRNGKR